MEIKGWINAYETFKLYSRLLYVYIHEYYIVINKNYFMHPTKARLCGKVLYLLDVIRDIEYLLGQYEEEIDNYLDDGDNWCSPLAKKYEEDIQFYLSIVREGIDDLNLTEYDLRVDGPYVKLVQLVRDTLNEMDASLFTMGMYREGCEKR